MRTRSHGDSSKRRSLVPLWLLVLAAMVLLAACIVASQSFWAYGCAETCRKVGPSPTTLLLTGAILVPLAAVTVWIVMRVVRGRSHP